LAATVMVIDFEMEAIRMIVAGFANTRFSTSEKPKPEIGRKSEQKMFK
jgi:hypothetical protein